MNDATRTAVLVTLGLLGVLALIGFAFAPVLALPVLAILGGIALLVARRR